ncbi:MAG TPA: MATE family efflux transporter [Gammaproteobacteria bacterium]|nr:MATE family efflux transporter [Gammaproteobacteria bacterium]
MKPELKNNLISLLKLAIPLVLTGLVQSGSYFFETLFLAHLNKDILAAGALVSWLFATIAVIFFGALGSINITISHKYGAGKHPDIAAVLRDGLAMAILFSIPIFILSRNMAPIFIFFGQTKIVATLAQSYLHALSWGIIPGFCLIALLEMLVGLGHVRTVMLFSMYSVSLTIFFSYALIFGKFGFAPFGIAGAGWGIAIGNIATFLIVLIYTLISKKYKIYLQLIFKFKSPFYFFELLRIGIPMGLMYSVEVGFFFTMTLIMGTLGTAVLAANQIAMQYLGLLMSMVFSVAQAITVRMGHLLGAKDIQSAKQTAIIGPAVSGVFMLLIGLIFWFFPSCLVSIDFNTRASQNQELLFYTMQFLLISPLFQIVEAIRISLFGVLRALRDTHFTLLTSIISFWFLALPIGYALTIWFNMGGSGFWYGMILGASASIVMLIWRYNIKIRRLHSDATKS